MQRLALILFIVLLAGACQQATEPSIKLTAVRCGSLIDGLADQALGSRIVLIEGQRIVSVLPLDAKIPTTAQLIDLREYTCLPGLIDTHTHLALVHDDSSDLTIYYRRPIGETLAMT